MPEQTIHTIQIKTELFNKLKSQGIPLFYFFRAKERNRATHNYDVVWKPELSSLRGELSSAAFSKARGNSALAFGKTYVTPIDNSRSRVYVEPGFEQIQLEEFNPDDASHVKALFRLHIYKRQNSSDKFACRELLWYLSNCFLNINVINEVIMQFDATGYRPYVYNELRNLAICLSIPKQKLIQKFLSSKNIQSNIFFPAPLIDALRIVMPDYDAKSDWDSSIFDLISKIVIQKEDNPDSSSFNVLSDETPSNFFIKIRRWIIDENYVFEEFDQLSRLIRLFSPQVQMTLLKRYFLAIHKGQTCFNLDLVKSFWKNKFDNWGVYYHCLYEASNSVPIGLQLLTDNIITFLESGGQALQTINGTLDMAYAECDANNPNVNFELEKIVPRCDGGAVPNKEFLGFVCTTVVYELNKQLFDSSREAFNLGVKLLKLIGTQEREYICKTKQRYQECDYYKQHNTCSGCAHFRTILHERWTVNSAEEDTFKAISVFLKTPISKEKNRTLTRDDILTDPIEVRNRVVVLLNDKLRKTQAHGNFNEGYIKQSVGNLYLRYIIDDVLKPSWMKIEARDNTHIGMGILASKLGVHTDEYDRDGEASQNARSKEMHYIKPHIIKAIKELIGCEPESDGVSYLQYDMALLRQLNSTFYSFRNVANSNSLSERNTNFLTKTRAYGYCAPEYKGDVNSVINLPYFCCRGNECFRNALSHQTVATCPSWREFNILHILEILGHPQIKQTDAGFEPTELIRSFIGLVNKAALLFRRVVCRDCGHILFPKHRTAFNRYNRFKCCNPICTEHNKEVYLSQCHQCKSGLIDSRDSKRCPNGWLICPTCLGCCTDEQIDRQAQKYEMRRCPVPQYIQKNRGLGHNNKEEFFCPKCGDKIEFLYDPERNERHIICSRCRTEYRDAENFI